MKRFGKLLKGVIQSAKLRSASASRNTVKFNGDEEQAEELAQAKREILKLRADMRRLEEERDILKKAARYFAKNPG